MPAEADHPLRKQCPEMGHYYFTMHKESTLIHLFISPLYIFIIFPSVISINNKWCSPALEIKQCERNCLQGQSRQAEYLAAKGDHITHTLIKAKP